MPKSCWMCSCGGGRGGGDWNITKSSEWTKYISEALVLWSYCLSCWNHERGSRATGWLHVGWPHFLFLLEPPVRNTWVVKHNLFNQKPSRSLRAYCNCSFLLQYGLMWLQMYVALGRTYTHIHTLAIVWHERLAVSLGSRIALWLNETVRYVSFMASPDLLKLRVRINSDDNDW